MPFTRAQQAHVRAARDELLDQLQVGRVVLDVEQRAQLRAASALRRRIAAGSARSTDEAAAQRPRSARTRTRFPRRRCFPRRSRRPSVRPAACSPPGRCPCLPRAPLSCPSRLNGWKSCASFSGGNPAPVSLTLMRMRSGALAAHSTTTVPLALVVLDRVGKQVDENLLQRGSDRH